MHIVRGMAFPHCYNNTVAIAQLRGQLNVVVGVGGDCLLLKVATSCHKETAASQLWQGGTRFKRYLQLLWQHRVRKGVGFIKLVDC